MAQGICPFKITADNYKQTCTVQCPLWHEQQGMCSFKATALYLHDIHTVLIGIATRSGMIESIEEKEEKEPK